MKSVFIVLLFTAFLRFSYSQEQEVTAILNLESNGINDKTVQIIRQELRSRLAVDTQLLVLDEEITKVMLQEQGIDRNSACANLQCYTGIGHLLTVSKVIGGAVTREGGNISVTLSLADVTGSEMIYEETFKASTMNSLLKREIPKCIDRMLDAYHYWKKSNAKQHAKSPDQRERKRGNVLLKTLTMVGTGAIIAGGGAALYFMKFRDSDDSHSITQPGTSAPAVLVDIPIDDTPTRER